MGYDLKPRNKSAGSFHMGAFSWSWMMSAGVGWPIGTGRGVKPGEYVFNRRPDGLDVNCNDGALVTAREARDMAKVASWVCFYQDTLHEVWQREPAEEREKVEADWQTARLYNLPVRRDFVELVRRFSEWAEKSGGFRVF